MKFPLTFEDKVQHWPDVKPEHIKCKFLGGNNTTYYTDLHETEVELLKFLLSLKHKIRDSEMTKLFNLIEDYGLRKFSEGGIEHES